MHSTSIYLTITLVTLKSLQLTIPSHHLQLDIILIEGEIGMTFLPQITAEKMASRREAVIRACHKCSFEMREIKRKHVWI